MSMRRLTLVAALLLGGAATAQQMQPADTQAVDVPQKQQEDSLSVEEILTTPAQDTESNPRCISTARVRKVHVMDDQHIAFEMGRGVYYLVQFRRSCPMLERDAAVVYEANGQLCRLDVIRPIQALGASTRLGPPCQIPEFQKMNRDQFLLVKKELKNSERRPDLVDPPPAQNKPD